MKIALLSLLSCAFLLASSTAGAAVGKDKGSHPIDCTSTERDDAQCMAMPRNGSCKSTGSLLVYESKGNVVVRVDEAIHVLSTTGASCGSYESFDDFKKAAELSPQKKALTERLRRLLFSPSCSEILNSESYKEGGCASEACNSCVKVLEQVRSQMRKNSPGIPAANPPPSSGGATDAR